MAVENEAGEVVTTDNSTTVTLALAENPAGATLTCTNPQGRGPVAVHSGLAAFTCWIDRAGSGYVLAADDATSAPAHPYARARGDTFAVTSGAANQLVFIDEPVDTTSGSPIAPAVRVALEDPYGNTVTGDNNTAVTLALATNPGGATLSGTGTTTVAGGIATFSDLSLDAAGAGYTLTASSSPATSTATSASFDVVVGPPAQLVFTGEPTNTSAGTPIDPAIQVTVEDAAGNTLDNDNTTKVTLSLGANPGGSSLGGTLTQTAQNGVAIFPDVSLSTAGSGYTLTATSNPVTTTVTSAPFDIGASGIVGVRLLTTNAGHPCTSGTSCTTGAFTATPGATLLVLVQRADSTKTTDTVTAITGAPVLLSAPAASIEYPVGTGRDYLFAWSATATGLTGSVKVDFAPGSNANPTVIEVVELSGVNLLFPIVQAPTNSSPTGNASAALASPDSANGELIMVAFRHDKPLDPPLGFGTVDAFRNGSDGGDAYGVFFNQSAQGATTILEPHGGGGGGWGTIAIELAHS